MTRSRRSAELLWHPLFLAALGLLLLNDHLLKDRWPGAVTGKLSDVAGPIVVAFGLAAITRRPRLALGLTAVGFTALKLSPTVATMAAPVLGGVTRTDPLDLIGLLGLIPAGIVLTASHRRGRAEHPLPADDPPPTRPQPRRAAARREAARQLATVTIASVSVFAVTATSCDQPDRGFTGVFATDDEVIAQFETFPGDPLALYRSADGGRTWESTISSDLVGPEGADPDVDLIDETGACLDDGRCFRTVPGERVEELVGGRWETSFRFSDEDIRRMEARVSGCSTASNLTDFFAAITVADDPIADGQTVLVTMGGQGMLRLDPDTDQWDRVGIGPYEPISVFGPRWLGWLAVSPFVALVASPALVAVGRNRQVSGNRQAVAVITNVALTLALGAIVVFLFVLSFGTFDYAWGGLLTLAATLVVAAVSLAIVLPSGRQQ